MGRRKHAAETTERKRLGAEITRRMLAAGMTQADLAAAAALDDSQMSKVLAGRAGLSLSSLSRVAAALGCSRADILTGMDARPRRVVRSAPNLPDHS
jgi:transcriptional regulator with XRE-family HTH domain